MTTNGKANATLHAALRRRAAISAEKSHLQADYEQRIAALDAESDSLDKAIQTINAAAASYLCPKCGGDGELRRPDAAGQTETVSCPVCKGTGLKQN